MSSDTDAAAVEWIAVDWGTSNLRCWAVGAGGEVLARRESGDGMSPVAAAGGDFESALLGLVEEWLDDGVTAVVACGMVGARGGWCEVPYVAVPCAPVVEVEAVPVRDRRMAVWVCGGVSQTGPADVMRGEERQVAGLLGREPGFEGTVCLPGTHSKWVRVAGGEIAGFRTHLTGEVFGLLAGRSVLRDVVADAGWDAGAFGRGVRATLDAPEGLLAGCFSLRAEALLEGLGGVAARSRLSGLLIGSELAEVRRSGVGGRVVVVGSGTLAEAYVAALGVAGIEAETADGEPLVLAGLAAARARLVRDGS